MLAISVKYPRKNKPCLNIIYSQIFVHVDTRSHRDCYLLFFVHFFFLVEEMAADQRKFDEAIRVKETKQKMIRKKNKLSTNFPTLSCYYPYFLSFFNTSYQNLCDEELFWYASLYRLSWLFCPQRSVFLLQVSIVVFDKILRILNWTHFIQCTKVECNFPAKGENSH